jgi:signal transduction histidine kinase
MCSELLSTISLPSEVTAELFCGENVGKLSTDPLILKRILTNLLNNAVQAMPNGGKLTLKAQIEQDDAVISVTDTGAGIPVEVREKLFTPLFTTKSKGQGFGLAVVKRMTEALGGNVSFESEEGKGTVFIVRLPASSL